MIDLTLDLTFHSPFRINTGLARPGLQDTVDQDDLLPTTSVKGLLRASAENLVGDAEHVVGHIFGTKRCPSPWAFGPVEWLAPWQTMVRTRVAIDPVSGAALKDDVYTGEEIAFSAAAPVPHARLRVTLYRRLPEELPDGEDHLAVLACAAAGVQNLGADRRRGLGWVSVVPHLGDGSQMVTAETVARLRRVAARPAGTPGNGPAGTPADMPGATEAPDDTQAPGVPVAPDGPDIPSTENAATELEVTVMQEQDLFLGTRPRGTAPAHTHTHIPGATLRGALAGVWLRERGLRTPKPALEAFAGLFEGAVTYGPLHADGSDVVPLSVLRCKYGACGAQIDAAFETGGTCACGPMVAGKGRVEYTDPQGVVVQRSRLELDDTTQTAKDGQLYTRQAVRAGAVRRRFTGRIGETGTLDREALEFLTGTRVLRFGGKLSSAGEVTYSARVVQRNRSDADPTDLLVLRFLSPVVLTDSSGLPVDPSDLEQIAEAVGHDVKAALDVEVRAVERAWSRPDTVGGWHVASRLYKPVDAVLVAGTVVRVRLDAPVDADSIARLESRGIGLRRAEGFGAVRVAVGPWQAPLLPEAADVETHSAAAATSSAEKQAERYARTLIAAGIGRWAAKHLREYTIEVLRHEAPRSTALADLPKAELETSDKHTFKELLTAEDQVLDRTTALLDALTREDQ